MPLDDDATVQLSLADLGGAAPGAVPDATAEAPARAAGRRGAERRTHGLVLLAAAYAPDSGRPICPRCWSAPALRAGRGRDRDAPRGWSTTATEGSVELDGRAVALTATIYRCSNAACPTALELLAPITGGYVPSLVAEHRLTGADAAAYAAGRTRRDGVWVAADGSPRTAGAQRELF